MIFSSLFSDFHVFSSLKFLQLTVSKVRCPSLRVRRIRELWIDNIVMVQLGFDGYFARECAFSLSQCGSVVPFAFLVWCHRDSEGSVAHTHKDFVPSSQFSVNFSRHGFSICQNTSFSVPTGQRAVENRLGKDFEKLIIR